MKHRIAILSDIHGNTTALEAVIKDAQETKRSNQPITSLYFLTLLKLNIMTLKIRTIKNQLNPT